MNKVFLTGRVVANPASFAIQSDKPNSKFDLAVNDSWNTSETYFFPCKCFGSTAKFANSYLKKGDFVILEGRLTRRKYQTKDGKTAYSLDIYVDSIQPVSNSTSNNNVTEYLNQYKTPTHNSKLGEKVSIDEAFDNEKKFNKMSNDTFENNEEKVPEWMDDMDDE